MQSNKQFTILQMKISSVLKNLVVANFIVAANCDLVTAQNFAWAKQMGGSGSDESRSVVADRFGNVYTVGTFSGTADFDPGIGIFNLTSAGSLDIFVSKLDASGNFVWAKQVGDAYGDRAYDVAVDDSGNVYTTGFFTGTVDFDPGVGTFNMSTPSTVHGDAYILKLDNAGNFVWAVEFGDIQSDRGISLCIDTAGYICSTGIYSGTVDFDPGIGVYNLLTITGVDHIYISKLSASGNFIWAKSFGAGWNQGGASISVDNFGNVYTAGVFWGIGDFDPGAATYYFTSFGYSDIFISKLNPSGDFVWAKQFGDTLYDSAQSIAIDSLGNVLTTGTFYGTVDFDPGTITYNLNSIGETDVFVSKLDSSGNFIWAKQFGDTISEGGFAIALDDTGNVFTTGFFRGTVDFDPGVGINYLTADSLDVFISKLDSSGNFMWVKQIGGNNIDVAFTIDVDGAGNIYTAGYFSGTADFDTELGIFNLTSFGQSDIFVHKLGQSINAISENSFTDSFTIYPNPVSSTLFVSFKKAEKITILNMLGEVVVDKIVSSNKKGIETFDISELSSGIYSVKADNEVLKFVKQ